MLYTYPKYPSEGWNVIAHPNGDLIESKKGRKLYSLFWEGTTTNNISHDNTGFVVAADDLEDFFEEKLAQLGLNFKEA